MAERELALEGLLGDGGELVEGLDVLIGHLREDLAVELDAGELEAVHELRVGDLVHAGGGVDAGDPQAADLALLVATVAVLILERVLHLLLGVLVAARRLTVIALGAVEDCAALLLGAHCALDTCHI